MNLKKGRAVITLRVEYNGKTGVVSVENPVRLDGWGRSPDIIKWGMGYAYLRGSKWDISRNSVFNFLHEGDDGVWEANVEIPGGGVVWVRVTDMSFVETS